MHGRRLILLTGAICLLLAGGLLVPSTVSAVRPPAPQFTDCRDITIVVTYRDEYGVLQSIQSNPSRKYTVPVNTILYFHTFVHPDKQGQVVTFNGQNPYLFLLGADEGPLVTKAADGTRYKLVWQANDSADGYLRHWSRITQPNKLITVGAQVAGGRCSAKIELLGRQLIDPCADPVAIASFREPDVLVACS